MRASFSDFVLSALFAASLFVNCREAEAVVNGSSFQTWPSMGAVIIPHSDGFFAQCGATLIAPNWAITAAHCTNDTGKFQFTMSSNYLAMQATYYTADQIIADSRYIIGGDSHQTHDIALLHFPTAIPGLPLRINDDADALHVADAAWISGYGQTVIGAEGAGNNSARKVGQIAVGTVAADLLSSSSGAQACFGDSGGPWFKYDADGFPLVVGVISAVDGMCNATSYAAPTTNDLDFLAAHVSDLCLRSTVGLPCEGIFRSSLEGVGSASGP